MPRTPSRLVVPFVLLLTSCAVGAPRGDADRPRPTRARSTTGVRSAPPTAAPTTAAPARVTRTGPKPSALQVTGRVLGADGRPPRQPFAVRVSEHQDGFDVFASIFVLTLGGPAGILACITGSGICTQPGATTVRLPADGRFAVRAPNGADEYDVTVLSLTGTEAEARVSVRVEVPSAGVRLPDLRLWDARPRVRAVDGTVRFEWPPLPARFADRPEYDVFYADGSAAPLVEKTATWAAVDDRVLEDRPGRARVVARGGVGGLTVSWNTPSVRYPAPAGAPLSRGKTCRVVVQGAAADPPGRCWLGDGKGEPYRGPRRVVCFSDEPSTMVQCGKRPVVEVRMDLGAVHDLGEVRRVRCRGCAVSVSADGRTWSAPVVVDEQLDYGEPVRLAAGSRGRYVRLYATGRVEPVTEPEFEPVAPVVGPYPYGAGSNDLALVPEMSVWGPRPAPPADPRSPGGTAREVTPAPDRPGARGGTGVRVGARGPVLGLAGLVLAAAVAGVAYAAGRRRRPTPPRP